MRYILVGISFILGLIIVIFIIWSVINQSNHIKNSTLVEKPLESLDQKEFKKYNEIRDEKMISFIYPADWEVTESVESVEGNFGPNGERQITILNIIEARNPTDKQSPVITIYDDCQGQSEGMNKDFIVTGEDHKTLSLFVCLDGYLFDGWFWENDGDIEEKKELIREIAKSFLVERYIHES